MKHEPMGQQREALVNQLKWECSKVEYAYEHERIVRERYQHGSGSATAYRVATASRVRLEQMLNQTRASLATLNES